MLFTQLIQDISSIFMVNCHEKQTQRTKCDIAKAGNQMWYRKNIHIFKCCSSQWVASKETISENGKCQTFIPWREDIGDWPRKTLDGFRCQLGSARLWWTKRSSLASLVRFHPSLWPSEAVRALRLVYLWTQPTRAARGIHRVPPHYAKPTVK